MPAPKSFVTNITTDFPEQTALTRKFERLSRDPRVRALSDHLGSAGFKPVGRGKDAFFGLTNKFKSSDGKTASFEMAVQSYAKAGSKDAAGLATVTLTSGENSATYHFTLLAPNGDFQKPLEHFTDGRNRVLRAKSWWTRWTRCLRSRCAATCLSALVTCSGTWAAYFWCVVAKCGGCVLRCAGCATCDCRWWCRWAVGCCEG